MNTSILPLADKLALVTGASGNIGSAVAKRLAAEGAVVVVHYNANRSAAQVVVDEIQKNGGQAILLGADLSRLSGPAELYAQIDRHPDGKYEGRLDILINNAGMLSMASLVEATDDSFDQLFNLNVKAVFQLSREAGRRMSKRGWGRIVNIGSIFGGGAYFPGISLYSGTKFAVRGLTQAWSRDLGPNGITVNNVEPALIQATPTPTEGPAFEAMQRFTSVGRFGTAEEIAEAVTFLAGPKAGFINGVSLNVDGGWRA